ncbi:hypothetical protein [Gordonia malaquae]|uniref:hypothetical protein n=1 Tax=Gordonia malaquae TaxID=410332 RepID=UPI00301ACB96
MADTLTEHEQRLLDTPNGDDGPWERCPEQDYCHWCDESLAHADDVSDEQTART